MRFLSIIFGLGTLVVVSVKATEEQSISFWDMIPGIAQGKSLVQLIFGDKEGAVKTQEHFLNEGLGTSQLRSGYFLVTGEPKKALEIQKKFVSNLEGVLDGIPVVGHVKGGIHLLAGEHDHGWQAIKAATSTSGAIAGAMLAGPVGAVGGHFLTDTLISATDAVLNGNQSQPHGLVQYVLNIDKLKPGEHFDVLASLVLDAKAGKKGINKRGWFNVGRLSHEESAESYELEPLLEKKEIDNQRKLGMPKRTITEVEETEPNINEPGPSKSTRSSTKAAANEKLNLSKFFELYQFFLRDPTYKDYNFQKLWTNEMSTDSLVKFNFDGLENFQYDNYLDNLNIDLLKNKLGYLTDDEKSLINKHDFRTINTEFSGENCLPCSFAGIMKLNLETVRSYIRKNLRNYPLAEFKAKLCLESLKNGKLIKYTTSRKLSSIQDINTYLKSNAKNLENKHILLEENLGVDLSDAQSDGKPGHIFVMKFKMVKDNPEPVKLLVDYQHPGFLQPDVPNPFRFQNVIDTQRFKEFYVHAVELLK